VIPRRNSGCIGGRTSITVCRRILEAAGLAEGKDIATVLGSGVAAEIPLAELARRFDRLILVDMDGPSMLESLDQVPLDLRSKVELRVMDVTSFATALMGDLRDAVDASSSAGEAYRRYQAIFDSLAAGNSANLPPSDLVVSSLLLSEIPRYPFAYANRLVQERFNTPLEAWDGFDRAFAKLVSVSIEDHGRLLAWLACPGGVVYYGDTLMRGPVYRQVSPETRSAVEKSLLFDFQRLGLAESASAVGPAIQHLCQAEHRIDTEVEAFERLLAAYRQAGGNVFEPLLPVADMVRQFEQRGFNVQGAPQSWRWNISPGRGHWITIQTEGTKSNRDGIGTKIRLTGQSGRVQYNHVTTSVGYVSSISGFISD
jgi:hypothetical protein